MLVERVRLLVRNVAYSRLTPDSIGALREDLRLREDLYSQPVVGGHAPAGACRSGGTACREGMLCRATVRGGPLEHRHSLRTW